MLNHTSMGKNKGNETVTVESLLRLKRAEQPGDQFWSTFDADFERRRLNALMERDDPRTRWAGLLKISSFALPALFLGTLGYFFLENELPRAGTSKPAVAEASQLETLNPLPAVADTREARTPDGGGEPVAMAQGLKSQFVLDAIEDPSSGRLDFRKVLYTPAIHLSSSSGSLYVNDSLSSRNYNVTRADLKIGRNF
jgi:hypothetical protein